MPNRVKWVPEALADVERLRRFLLSKHPGAAARAVSTIIEGAKLLESSPQIGRPLADGTGRRELSLSFGSGAYMLRYILEDEHTAVVLRVWHSRENRTD